MTTRTQKVNTYNFNFILLKGTFRKSKKTILAPVEKLYKRHYINLSSSKTIETL